MGRGGDNSMGRAVEEEVIIFAVRKGIHHRLRWCPTTRMLVPKCVCKSPKHRHLVHALVAE